MGDDVSLSNAPLRFICLFFPLFIFFCNILFHQPYTFFVLSATASVLPQWYWLPIEPTSGNPCISTPSTPSDLCVQVEDLSKWSGPKVCVSESILLSFDTISITINDTQKAVILEDVEVAALEPCSSELDGHVQIEDPCKDFLTCPGKYK